MLVEDRAGGSAPEIAPPDPRTDRWLRRGAAVATGLLGGLAFPPFDLGWTALVALAPLVWAWRGVSPARAARLGWLSGFTFFGVVLWWSISLSPVALPLLAALQAAWWAGAGAVVALLARRGVRGPVVVTAVWVAMESIRGSWPFGGLTWGELGYAFHDTGWMRALAPFGGVRLITAVSVLTAALLVELVLAVAASRRDVRRPPVWVRPAAGLVVVGLLVVACGHVDTGVHPTTTLRIAAVQGNDLNRELTREELQARYLPANHLRLADTIDEPVDLVVFPESSLDADPRSDAFELEGIQRTAQRLGATVIANYSNVPRADGRLSNTNFYFDADGQLVGMYIKRHLVPFGEYIPFRGLFGGLSVLERVGRDKAPGPGRVLWELDGVPFGSMICFESAFAGDARNYAADGAQFLVLTTNNRSYERTSNSRQHVAMTQLRAAETGRPIVHSAISGITAFIDADGDVVLRTGLFEPTVAVADVTAMTGRTPYVRWGEWVVALAWIVVAVSTVRATVSWWRSRSGARRPDGTARPGDTVTSNGDDGAGYR